MEAFLRTRAQPNVSKGWSHPTNLQRQNWSQTLLTRETGYSFISLRALSVSPATTRASRQNDEGSRTKRPCPRLRARQILLTTSCWMGGVFPSFQFADSVLNITAKRGSASLTGSVWLPAKKLPQVVKRSVEIWASGCATFQFFLASSPLSIVPY
jgi:hypothetical protein